MSKRTLSFGRPVFETRDVHTRGCIGRGWPCGRLSPDGRPRGRNAWEAPLWMGRDPRTLTYRVEAWIDEGRAWQDFIVRKCNSSPGDTNDLRGELSEGLGLVSRMITKYRAELRLIEAQQAFEALLSDEKSHDLRGKIFEGLGFVSRMITKHGQNEELINMQKTFEALLSGKNLMTVWLKIFWQHYRRSIGRGFPINIY